MSTLSKPYTFTAGTYAVASQVNATLDTIYSWINSNAIWADASIAFTGVPVGPNTDPTTGNQFTRKSYVDNKFPSGGRIQGGTVVTTTNGSGQIAIPFTTAFATAVTSVIVGIGDVGLPKLVLEVVQTSLTVNGCTVQCYDSSTGAALGSGSGLRINWIALGY